MPTLGLETRIIDPEIYSRSVQQFYQQGIRLPSFAELADPNLIDSSLRQRLVAIDPDSPHPLNLFRIHWYNAPQRSFSDCPEALELPVSLTGVPARIVVLLADRFPMIRAHKVLASYSCLVPRLITGQFDPTCHRAVWPSTGNYCRGGVAVSRICGCRSVAVLPEGMSRERFDWLESWVESPDDIVRTPGSESNVKEIYDRCAELGAVPENIVFNQFSEFGNYLGHYQCTGPAVGRVFEHRAVEDGDLRLAAFVSATGSAGTLAAGDYLKRHYGSKTVAVEALECPTMLYNGFGEHNIQGIGDKHIPLIHNVMGTDLVTAVSDRATDSLFVLFNSETGRHHLANRWEVPAGTIAQLHRLGLSAICNVLAAIKVARYLDLGPRDVVATVATDGMELYRSEIDKILRLRFGGEFDALTAAEVAGRFLAGTTTDHLLELSYRERLRIFNLGYFTWVEQQGIASEEFTARREAGFWRDLLDLLPAWDELIREFNHRTGVTSTGS